jgi:hypothetical protein
MSAISAIPAIANAMTMKDLISAVSALTADERSEFRAILFPDAPKAGRPKKVAPAEPVLKDGWVFQPYTKGAKKGQDRWYNEAEDEHTDDRSVCFSMPAPAKAKVAPVKGAEPKKRLSKEEKESMSPDEKKALKAKKAAESAERKAKRTPEEQAKIDERTAKAKATREAKKAGGSAEAPQDEEEEDGSAAE